MAELVLPSLRIPPPLRGDDTIDDFTRISILVRLPAIVQETIDCNPHFPASVVAQLGDLKQEISSNALLTPLVCPPPPPPPPFIIPSTSSSTSAAPSADNLLPHASEMEEWKRWETYVAPHIEAKETWLSAPWFFVENYMYKRILAITKAAFPTLDPFASQKQKALEAATSAFHTTVVAGATIASSLMSTSNSSVIDFDAKRYAIFRACVHRSLWGNRADLSLSAGKVEGHANDAAAAALHEDDRSAFLLADDTLRVQELLGETNAERRRRRKMEGEGEGEATTTRIGSPAKKQSEIVIILDNCGLELLTDLVLAYVILTLDLADRVTLMCKTCPVFVSDAMPVDVDAHIEWLIGQNQDQDAANNTSSTGAGAGADVTSPAHALVTNARSLGFALQALRKAPVSTTTATTATSVESVSLSASSSSSSPQQPQHRLGVESHWFFTSPLPAWEMPNDLRCRLASATLAIVKGDANYRRLLADSHWVRTTPFQSVLMYYPCPLVALRTCKAGVIVGLTREAESEAEATARDWLVSGTYGVIQFARPAV